MHDQGPEIHADSHRIKALAGRESRSPPDLLMKPIEFPEQNMIFAKDQPEYLPLPVHAVDEPQNRIISQWKFSFWERVRVLFGANMWFIQMAFHQPLQPQLPTLDSPFK